MKNRFIPLQMTKWVYAIVGFRILLHLVINLIDQYGIFRDEFYYLACADHLAWGYVDHPPLSIFFLWIERFLFGESLFAIRLFPAILGGLTTFAIAVFTCELGGRRYAQITTAMFSIAAPIYLALTSYYSMNSFDVFLWSVALVTTAKLVNGLDKRYWFLLGAILGLGLLNKISVLWLGFGIFAGILLTSHRYHLKTKWPWLAALLALGVFLPHLIWQIVNQWPTLEFIHNASTFKNVHMPPLEFLSAVMMNMNPALVLFWIAGLVFAYFTKSMKQHLWAVWFIIGIMIVFLVSGSAKPYYAAAALLPLLSFAGIALERWTSIKPKLKWIRYLVIVYTAVAFLVALPMALPVLPVPMYLNYSEALGMQPAQEEHHDMGVLPQFYADRFGWKQLADLVAGAYDSLPPEEQADCVVYTINYGRAGAIEYYTSERDFPPVVCNHNSYWLWGPGEATGNLVIVVGENREGLEQSFETVEFSGRTSHPWSMPYENNVPVWICRNLDVSLQEIWPNLKTFN